MNINMYFLEVYLCVYVIENSGVDQHRFFLPHDIDEYQYH